MARKKIHTTKVGTKCSVSIYRDAEWGEFVVQAKVNGKVVGGKDGGAFESDKKAARSTAAAIIKQLRRKQSVCS